MAKGLELLNEYILMLQNELKESHEEGLFLYISTA